MTSAVIWQYRDMIRVAGLWLLTSRTYAYRHYPGSWIMTSAVILYFTPIIRVAGLRLLPSYYTIHPLSGHLDYDFCSHIMLYTHYPGSWITTSAVILYYTPIIRVAGLRLLPSYTIHHYPGSWTMTSAVIWQYRDMIRVAGLRLLQSYDSIETLSV